MKMDLSVFLNYVVQHKTVPHQQSVICFYGIQEAPSLLWCAFRSYLRATCPLISVDLSGSALDDSIACLHTTFLGNYQIYWLGDITILSDDTHDRVIRILQNYTGPHTLVLFSGQECVVDQQYGIVLPKQLDQALFAQLVALYHLSDEMVVKLITYDNQKIVRKNIYEVCVLLQYASVMGRLEHYDLHELMRIYGHVDTSLFKLSQAFFEKKEPLFFRIWSELHTQYTAPFWTAFWSEQIWRAVIYSELMRANKNAEAKSIGYRLPFAFLQHGWQRSDNNELKRVHSLVCDLEYNVKNGGDEQFIDLVYLKYFTGVFKK